jgi:hypothetical protein
MKLGLRHAHIVARSPNDAELDVSGGKLKRPILDRIKLICGAPFSRSADPSTQDLPQEAVMNSWPDRTVTLKASAVASALLVRASVLKDCSRTA